MQMVHKNVFARPDTMFGVCQSLGQDLGISPNWFRVALAAVVIYNIEIAVVTYAVLAAIVFASRVVYPSKAKAKVQVEAAPAVVAEAPVVDRAPVLAEAA